MSGLEDPMFYKKVGEDGVAVGVWIPTSYRERMPRRDLVPGWPGISQKSCPDGTLIWCQPSGKVLPRRLDELVRGLTELFPPIVTREPQVLECTALDVELLFHRVERASSARPAIPAAS